MGNTTSVNELNCWKAIAASTNQASFIEVFGRDPQPGEVEGWVNELRADAESEIERNYEERLVKVNIEQWRWERIL